jgi:hypothetical protein
MASKLHEHQKPAQGALVMMMGMIVVMLRSVCSTTVSRDGTVVSY